MLCDDREGWDEGQGRSKAQEGGNICILIYKIKLSGFLEPFTCLA